MNRTHAVVIAVVLGLAAVFGLFAATRTVHLGQAARRASSAQLAAEQRRLATAERALRRQLTHEKARPGAAAQTPRTVYVRPAPIIVHLHRHGGEGEGDD